MIVAETLLRTGFLGGGADFWGVDKGVEITNPFGGTFYEVSKKGTHFRVPFSWLGWLLVPCSRL